MRMPRFPKLVRLLGLAAVVYGGGYVSFRASKLLVHLVSYDRYSVPNRDHNVVALRFRSPDGSASLFAHVTEHVFSPARKAETMFWRAIPRSYPYDSRVLAASPAAPTRPAI